MPFTDFSIDLETLDTSPRALITSIGIVGFNRKTGNVGIASELHVSILSQLFRRKISLSTVLWWMKQSKEAKKAFWKGQRNSIPLRHAMKLLDFRMSMNCHKDAKVWTNGPEFDCAILEDIHSNSVLFLKLPWKHWQNESVRSMRTVYKHITGKKLDDAVEFEGVKHSAGADATHQARLVIEAFKAIG